MSNHLVDDELYIKKMKEYFEFEHKAFTVWRAVKGTPLQDNALTIYEYFHRRCYEIAQMLASGSPPHPQRSALESSESSERETTAFEQVELCLYEGLCQECGRELDSPSAQCSCHCHELA